MDDSSSGYRFDAFLSYSRGGHWETFVQEFFEPILTHWLDGQTLATASRDQTALLWAPIGANADVADPLRRACALSGRGLSPDEWARYVPDLPYVDSCPA